MTGCGRPSRTTAHGSVLPGCSGNTCYHLLAQHEVAKVDKPGLLEKLY